MKSFFARHPLIQHGGIIFFGQILLVLLVPLVDQGEVHTPVEMFVGAIAVSAMTVLLLGHRGPALPVTEGQAPHPSYPRNGHEKYPRNGHENLETTQIYLHDPDIRSSSHSDVKLFCLTKCLISSPLPDHFSWASAVADCRRAVRNVRSGAPH